MPLSQVKGATWVWTGPQAVGLVRVDDTHCILLDPGSAKLFGAMEADLTAAGLIPVGVLCTHMHYDHHESTQAIRRTYGAAVCLPQGEADIVRSAQSLKNHLFCFSMGLVQNTPRLQNLIGPVDRVITYGENTVDFCGVPFRIIRTPGHSPDHICVITPDNVCFAGDALMTQDVLDSAKIPFAFDLADDLFSKQALGELDCDAWILCHNGVVRGSIAGLVQANLDRVRQQLAACAALVSGPMTFSQFYSAVIGAVGLAAGHPVRALYLERYIRPYLDYLVDTQVLELMEQDGAPAVRPKEAAHG